MRLMAPMQAIARQWGPSVVVERSESKACLLEFKTAELEYANPDCKLHGSLRVGDLISCRSCPKRCRKQPLCRVPCVADVHPSATHALRSVVVLGCNLLLYYVAIRLLHCICCNVGLPCLVAPIRRSYPPEPCASRVPASQGELNVDAAVAERPVPAQMWQRCVQSVCRQCGARIAPFPFCRLALHRPSKKLRAVCVRRSIASPREPKLTA